MNRICIYVIIVILAVAAVDCRASGGGGEEGGGWLVVFNYQPATFSFQLATTHERVSEEGDNFA